MLSKQQNIIKILRLFSSNSKKKKKMKKKKKKRKRGLTLLFVSNFLDKNKQSYVAGRKVWQESLEH